MWHKTQRTENLFNEKKFTSYPVPPAHVPASVYYTLRYTQVWRLDLGSSSPRRTHDFKIGYIPILMLILSVKASQVLVVPKNVGFSIPRCEPEPEPWTPWGQKSRPIDHPGIPRGQGRSTTHLWREIVLDPGGRLYQAGVGKIRRDLRYTKTPVPWWWCTASHPPFYPRCILQPSRTDDVIHCWAFCCGGLWR